jgi:hypothetical protein
LSVQVGQSPESVAAGQTPESVWCELHSVRLVICDDNRILCVGLLDVDLAGSIPFCHATWRPPSATRVIVAKLGGHSALEEAALTGDWLEPPDGP